jgi:hypothetical protein
MWNLGIRTCHSITNTVRKIKDSSPVQNVSSFHPTKEMCRSAADLHPVCSLCVTLERDKPDIWTLNNAAYVAIEMQACKNAHSVQQETTSTQGCSGQVLYSFKFGLCDKQTKNKLLAAHQHNTMTYHARDAYMKTVERSSTRHVPKIYTLFSTDYNDTEDRGKTCPPLASEQHNGFPWKLVKWRTTPRLNLLISIHL